MTEQTKHQWRDEEWLTAAWHRCPRCGTVKRKITADTALCPGPIAELVTERPNPCTCHPDDGPIIPCPKRYAYSECLLADKISKQAAEIERLRAGFKAIKQATIEGRVCDDVAWFDGITTLHDYCDQFIPPDE